MSHWVTLYTHIRLSVALVCFFGMLDLRFSKLGLFRCSNNGLLFREMAPLSYHAVISPRFDKRRAGRAKYQNIVIRRLICVFLSVRKLEFDRCCLCGENKYLYRVFLLEIGPIRLFAFEAGPIKLLVSWRLCMSSSSLAISLKIYLFCQRSEGTSFI